MTQHINSDCAPSATLGLYNVFKTSKGVRIFNTNFIGSNQKLE